MKRLKLVSFMVSIMVVSLLADTTYVNGVYSGGAEGSLNDAIQAKIDAGTLSNTVFKLNSYDWYVLTGTIKVPAGQTLEIVAPDPGDDSLTAPPQILWTASSSVTKNFMISVYGDLKMKNIWVRYADVSGAQTGTPIVFDGDTLGVTGDNVDYGIFENCIFEWMPCPTVTASGAICVRSHHFNGTFKNCFFRNCTDRHFMYYGRAVSFPFDVSGYHTDYCSFENCTFTNMGYVYMQEGTNYSDNVHFNHCTFYNIVMFPLESGWWHNLSVTNCLFVNPWMMGYIPAQGVSGATVTIQPVDSMSFEVPFTDVERHILFAHSAYYLDNWLVDWMRGGWTKDYNGTAWRPDPRIKDVGCGYSKEQYNQRLFDMIPYPRPMLDSTTLVFFDSTSTSGEKLYPYINRAALYDVYTAEDKDALDPGFVTPALNLGPLKWFLNEKWGTSQDTMWAYDVEAGFLQKWPLPENFIYTNETYKAAGMGGFPLGDLYHWWNPAIREGATDYYSTWLAQADQERAKIAQWLETGHHPDSVGIKNEPNSTTPSEFALSQNSPNPFNPTTQIQYSVPQAAHVSLKVYNTLGQEVMTLVDGSRPAGDYMVTLNGKGLSGGIYFYVLKSENIAITKKLVLIK